MIILRLGLTHDLAHRRRVAGFDSTAEGERQELFGQGADKQLWPIAQGRFEARHPGERAAIRKAAGSVDGLALFKTSPATDGIEVLQRKAGGIDEVMATG